MDRSSGRFVTVLVFAGLTMAGAPAHGAPSTPPPPPPGKPKPVADEGGRAPTTAPKPPGQARPTPAPATPPAPGTTTATPPPPSQGFGDGTEPEVDAKPVDLGDTWGYSRRTTPRPRYVRRSTNPILYAPNPIGFYSGVSVDGNQTPPNPAKKVGAPPATLTWTGFERTSEGSRVFFQLSDAAAYSVSRKRGTITIKMRRTKINVRNNRRRLDLSYFKTPVQSVKVSRKGGSAMATIVLKRDIEPTVRMIKGKSGSGYKLLVVEFKHRTSARSRRNRPNVPAK